MKKNISLEIHYSKEGHQTFSILGHDVTDTITALIQTGKGIISDDNVKIRDSVSPFIRLAIRNAEMLRSNLLQKKDILCMEGMSSQKVRHFLNSVCSTALSSREKALCSSNIFSEKNYFEVGCASGSTYISSNFNSGLNSSYVCDLFLEAKNGVNGKDKFLENCLLHLDHVPKNIFSEDCFKLDLNKFKHKINIYFYDGDHSVKSHELALTYFEDIFDDTVMVIIDDWDDRRVQLGTLIGLSKINYDIVSWFPCKGRTGFLELEDVVIKNFGITLNGEKTFGNLSAWWNGLLIIVLKKSSIGEKI